MPACCQQTAKREKSDVEYMKQRRGKYYYARPWLFSPHNQELPDDLVNKIMVGDSEQVLKIFPDNSIDLVFTSPPYNFGRDYADYDDVLPYDTTPEGRRGNNVVF